MVNPSRSTLNGKSEWDLMGGSIMGGSRMGGSIVMGIAQ